MYVLHPEAYDDIIDAVTWYEEQAAGLGERFLAALERTLERATERPRLGAIWTATQLPVWASVRRIRVPDFPYLVVYSVEVDHIGVLAIAHGRRNTGYWVRRVRS